MAKETFRPKDKFRNTFLAMIVAGVMKGPIENLPRQIEEGPSFVDAQKTPIHTLYFPQISNEEKVNALTPTSESTLAANRQPIHELSLALETTPTITLSPVGSPSPEATPGAEVVVNALNMRSGPGTAYPAIDGLFQGASVAVVGRAENGWFKVHWQEGEQEKEGWVSGKSAYVATNEEVEEAPLLTAEAISPSPTATDTPLPTSTLIPTSTETPTPFLASTETPVPTEALEEKWRKIWVLGGGRQPAAQKKTFLKKTVGEIFLND